MEAELWSVLIIVFGAGSGMLYGYATLRAKARGWPFLMGCLLVAISMYPAVLWGGQALGIWTITPEWGRPALVMTLAGLNWLALLIVGSRRPNERK